MCRNFRKNDVRANFDLRNEKIGFKIREQTMQKIPYLLVIGDKEMAANAVSVRKRDGTDLGIMPIDTLKEHLSQEILAKK